MTIVISSIVHRSAVYSDRARTCRLSRYNQKDGMRLLYDPDFDYYENLMRKYRLPHDIMSIPNFIAIHSKSSIIYTLIRLLVSSVAVSM